MARQWFAEGVQVHEDGTEEYFVEGVQVNEDQGAAPGGLSIPIAAYHYRREDQDMKYIRQGATHKVVIGPAVAVGDGFTPVTTLALNTADEAEVILHDNGTVVDISGYTFAAIATADGYYHLTLQSGISGTVGHMTVVINDDSLMLPLRADFTVLEEAIYDALFAASANAFAGAAGSSTVTFSNTTIGTVTTATNVTTVNGLAANVITAAATAADFSTEIRTAINGGDYALDTDANGRIRVVDGTGAGEINTNAGAIALVDLVTTVTNLTNAPTAGDLTATMKASVNSEVDTALADIRLDELLAADSDIDGAAPPTVGSVFHELMSATAGSFTFDQTTDSCEAIRNRGDSAWITATGFSTHSAADVWLAATRTLTALGFDLAAGDFAAGAIDANALATDAVNEIRNAITGGAYALDTDANGAVRIVDGTGARELNTSGGFIAGIAGTINTLDALDTAQDVEHDATQALIAALNDISAADVNAQVLDVLNVDTFAEPGQGAPAATASLVTKIGWLYAAWRNKKTQNSTTFSLFADDGTTVNTKSTLSDDGTTLTVGEFVTGP